MQVTVNDEKRECSDGTSVAELLEDLGIDMRYVAVEKNRQIIPRTQFNEIKLQESDTLEVVTFVGGG
ncbi:MAG: thiamine biosynthesis protein ThiS [Candidatus Scalindua sp.]|nr:MAG: sulfur carrier protein ThiS [Candidatus Scalindua sp.]NOG86139.1 sulfur carrier protein ThiS [Planctomycetota bacterium]RZV98901.1 MAG: sulfur carrier protein ThiS [Candidatus Scalindua sp. SCAELEC01]GJQ57712.1 MAG: thiamine biosynthesis protein ThiS [Candidatus Scalindua sp.]